jgi:hypothetical protein
MKPSSRPPRTPSELSDSVHHRLRSYELAVGAAGVGALAFAQPAEAKVVYTPADISLENNHQYNLDLNHDGVTDFVLANSYSCDLGCFYFCGVGALDGNAIDATGRSYVSARALAYGAVIGPRQHLQDVNAGMVDARNGGSSYVRGDWINVKNRYLGLKFNVGGKIHYGWARLTVKVSEGSDFDITARLTGYAYETIPNKPIIAGKTKGSDVIDGADPASLGRLARGSAGLAALHPGK